ncbi:hypothetical protein AMTRI_Chr02g255710 [Amborella trichopoda]
MYQRCINGMVLAVGRERTKKFWAKEEKLEVRMDLEQMLLRVHAWCSTKLSQLLKPRIRVALEYVFLVVAFALFCLLVVMHTNFVAQPGCSSELSGPEILEAHLVQIKITSAGLWTHKAFTRTVIDTLKQGELADNIQIPDVHGGGLKFITPKFWLNQIASGLKVLLDISTWLHRSDLEKMDSFIVQWLDERSKASEPTYLYTMEKGYFMLPEAAKSKHNVRTINVSISAQHPCFGNRWLRLLINSFVGYDTILMNSLLSAPGQGYLYNFQTKEFYDLSFTHESAEVFPRFEDYLVAKCGVLIMSLFVFFTTTMSVSFTLRETQSRMLKFTVQLQHHARHRLPTFQLIFVHVIESLVFVPIMIGILFFLFEFYDDQLLAFMVLLLVWLCEVFTMISVRTPISMQYFPRFFLLYFLVFHIYFFSYAYGFSYLAFYTTAAFMQHLVLYFWIRFEVPALQRFMRNRLRLQQQTGVHITSSAILTSTLHIARLNMRPPNPNDEFGENRARRPWPNPPDSSETIGSTEPMAQMGSSATNEPVDNQQIRSDPQQLDRPEDAPNPTSLSSLGSMLLWVFGVNGLVSLSRFRDTRDQQGQGYANGSEQENQRPQTPSS